MKQQFHLVNDAVKQNAINFIREFPVDQKRPLVLDIKEMTRILQQNAKLWPLLKDLSDQVVWFGNKYDSDDWKDLITAMVAKSQKQEQRMAPGLDGGIVMFGQRTSKMTIRQMVEVIEAAGPNTSTFYIRVKYDSLILESCLIAAWFKSSAYTQGGKLDAHEISQHKLVSKHTGSYPAAVIIECNSPRASNFGSIEIVQNTNDNPPVSYCGVGLYLGGSYTTVECYKYSRSPTIAAAYRGTELVLEGSNNRLCSGMLKGFFDTDSRGTPSSGIVASSGTHYVNCSIGFGNHGVRLVGGHLQGEIRSMGNLSTWQVGMESETTFARSMLKLYTDTNGNHGVVRGPAGAVSTNTTNVQQVQITGLRLPYVPASGEVTPHLVIDASSGSSIPPQSDAILYIPALSTVNTLTFQVRLTNTTSPMQTTIGARLN